MKPILTHCSRLNFTLSLLNLLLQFHPLSLCLVPSIPYSADSVPIPLYPLRHKNHTRYTLLHMDAMFCTCPHTHFIFSHSIFFFISFHSFHCSSLITARPHSLVSESTTENFQMCCIHFTSLTLFH